MGVGRRVLLLTSPAMEEIRNEEALTCRGNRHARIDGGNTHGMQQQERINCDNDDGTLYDGAQGRNNQCTTDHECSTDHDRSGWPKS